eukprot:g22576.t1
MKGLFSDTPEITSYLPALTVMYASYKLRDQKTKEAGNMRCHWMPGNLFALVTVKVLAGPVGYRNLPAQVTCNNAVPWILFGFCASMDSCSMERLFTCLFSFLCLATVARAVVVVVGDDQQKGVNLGWEEGVCYNPIQGILPGDELLFVFTAHNVYKMASADHFASCNFEDAELVAEVGESPFSYTFTEQDRLDGSIYFACKVGSHCQGKQKLKVNMLRWDPADGTQVGNEAVAPPVSTVAFGLTAEQCQARQSGSAAGGESGNKPYGSECTAPVQTEDAYFHSSCLSARLTMTPGGVINEATILHYPYPTDRRVAAGLRTWEFVEQDPSGGGVRPVNVNQLYIHHLSGRVVLGQGTEGVRRTAPDAPFPAPYALLTGDEGDSMGFHIIDIRGVDDWLPCIECRCLDGNGTYLDSDPRQSGGVSCCHNCSSTLPQWLTVDYQMRYNVSYKDIDSVQEILMYTADISPAVGKSIEYDVPKYTNLPAKDVSPTDPQVQHLVIEGQFKDLFKDNFFQNDYTGPKTVRLFRCVGHLHVAAIGMWLIDAETGQTLCENIGVHGTDPEKDKGLLISLTVTNNNPPIAFPHDRRVRLIVDYNASTLHTGVMGMWFVFLGTDRMVTAFDAQLSVPLCLAESCDATLLPSAPTDVSPPPCVDALRASPICRWGRICDCAVLTTLQPNSGCGGVFTTDFGPMPIDALCAKYCNACPEFDMAEHLRDTFAKRLEQHLQTVCVYSTKECRSILNNLYTCSMQQAGYGELAKPVQEVLASDGHRLATKYAQLGDSSLHRGVTLPSNITKCSNEVPSTVSPVESTVSPVESTVSPVESTVSPVESTVSPVESTVSPTVDEKDEVPTVSEQGPAVSTEGPAVVGAAVAGASGTSELSPHAHKVLWIIAVVVCSLLLLLCLYEAYARYHRASADTRKVYVEPEANLATAGGDLA